MQSRDGILIYIGIRWIFLHYFAQKVSLCNKFVRKVWLLSEKCFTLHFKNVERL